MRFRVTSISGEEDGKLISTSLILFEDWLNKALSDGAFGGNLDILMILIISSNARAPDDQRAPIKPTRFSTSKNPFTGNVERCLTLQIPVDAGLLLSVEKKTISAFLVRRIIKQLPEKPSRAPKELDYARLRRALQSCLTVLIDGKV